MTHVLREHRLKAVSQHYFKDYSIKEKTSSKFVLAYLVLCIYDSSHFDQVLKCLFVTTFCSLVDRLVLILEINSDTILENSTSLDHLPNSTVKYFSFASLKTWQSIKRMEGEERERRRNKKREMEKRRGKVSESVIGKRQRGER